MWRTVNLLGMAMAQALEERGQEGAMHMGTGFDNWYPGFIDHANNFRNVASFLTETGLYRYATPHFYTVDDFPDAQNDLRPQSLYASPWEGGWWRLGDAVDYMLTASISVLDLAAKYKDDLLYNRYQAGRDVIAYHRDHPPYAYFVPQEQRDPVAAVEMLRRLAFNGIRIHRTTAALELEGQRYPAGTWVIPMDQEFANFVRQLFAVQEYPDLREYPEGPPDQPYDVAGWTLPYLMDVRVVAATTPLEPATRALLEPLSGVALPWDAEVADAAPFDSVPGIGFDSHPGAAAIRPPAGRLTGSGAAIALDPAQNNAFRALNRAWDAGATVSFAPGDDGGSGRYLISGLGDADSRRMVDELAIAAERTGAGGRRLQRPRLGLYRPWRPSIDEGWTRWLLERYEFAFTSLPQHRGPGRRPARPLRRHRAARHLRAPDPRRLRQGRGAAALRRRPGRGGGAGAGRLRARRRHPGGDQLQQPVGHRGAAPAGRERGRRARARRLLHGRLDPRADRRPVAPGDERHAGAGQGVCRPQPGLHRRRRLRGQRPGQVPGGRLAAALRLSAGRGAPARSTPPPSTCTTATAAWCCWACGRSGGVSRSATSGSSSTPPSTAPTWRRQRPPTPASGRRRSRRRRRTATTTRPTRWRPRQQRDRGAGPAQLTPTFPERALELAMEAAREVGVDPADASVLRVASAVTVELPHAEVIARVEPPSGLAAARRQAIAARILEQRGVPAARLVAADRQPLALRDGVVTLWRRLRILAGVPSPEALGRLARHLHTACVDNLPAETPALDPFEPLPGWLDRPCDLAPPPGTDELRRRLDQLRERWRQAAVTEAPGTVLVHGDYHADNVVLTDEGPVLLDLEMAGRGPAELGPARPAAGGASATAARRRTTGASATPTVPSCPTRRTVELLQQAYELHLVCWAVGHRDTSPAMADAGDPPPGHISRPK